MKLGKILTLSAGLILAFIVGWLFMFTWGHNPTIVTLSPYDVNVPGKPPISAKVYTLKKGEYLLVLADASSGKCEQYWFCPDRKRIGVPSIPTYLPIGRHAVISTVTLDGFTYLGEYTADWIIKNNIIMFTIKGPPDTIRAARDFSTEDFKKEISYNRKIIMKPK
jgi:hypothetical protein